MAAGLIDADLGGGVVKKRGVARTLVATNKGNRWFFVFGFEKSERANIGDEELETLQELAGDLLVCFTETVPRAKIDRLVEIYTG